MSIWGDRSFCVRAWVRACHCAHMKAGEQTAVSEERSLMVSHTSRPLNFWEFCTSHVPIGVKDYRPVSLFSCGFWRSKSNLYMACQVAVFPTLISLRTNRQLSSCICSGLSHFNTQHYHPRTESFLLLLTLCPRPLCPLLSKSPFSPPHNRFPQASSITPWHCLI